MDKLFCHVDENGQDTGGRIFVVSIVVTGENRDKLLELCEQLEKVSGKRRDKWGRAKHERRTQYLRHILLMTGSRKPYAILYITKPATMTQPKLIP